MNPRKNQLVNIYFKNSVSIQGIVVEWTDGKSVLRSPHNRNLIIIHNTLENVQMVYIELEKPEKQPSKPTPQSDPKIKPFLHPYQPRAKSNQQKVRPQYPTTAPNNLEPDFATHTKNIAELHLLRAEEDKKAALEKARSFTVSNQSTETPYANPSFFNQSKQYRRS